MIMDPRDVDRKELWQVLMQDPARKVQWTLKRFTGASPATRSIASTYSHDQLCIRSKSSPFADMTTSSHRMSEIPSQRPIGSDLSFYEAPTFSLSPAAQRALAQLTRSHPLKKLEEGLDAAQKQLTESAGDINDRVTRKSRLLQKSQSVVEEEDWMESEQSLDQMRNKVQNMTQRMEASLRKLIDGQQNVQALLACIQGTAEDARINASTQASTQGIRSLRPRGTAAGDNRDTDNDADDDEGIPQTFDPTDPNNSAQARPPIEVFRSQLEDATTRYQSFPLEARYGQDNAYRDFKRLVHDAMYPDDDVPLPHHSEWFRERPAPAPGVRLTGTGADNEDEDDDDIAVSKATISTKCPITLQELKNPLTSKKCPHSFEKAAILEMIGSSNTRVPAPEGHRGPTQRAVQCPVPGCSQAIAKTDLHVDAVLIRKIGRIQRARQIQEEEEDEDDGTVAGTQRRTQIIEDEDDDDGANIDDLLEPEVSSHDHDVMEE